MCLAIPVKITKIVDWERKIALGEWRDVSVEVNFAGVGEVEVGDWVILHVGFAIEKVPPDYWEELAYVYNLTTIKKE